MRKLLMHVIFILLISLLMGDERDPGWQPVIYTNSTVAYCQVTINNEAAETGDILGAFAASECRGTGNIFFYNGESYSVMNIQGEQIETITFKLWDANEDIILDIDESVQSYPGHDLGYPPNFLELNASGGGLPNEPPVVDLPGEIEFDNIETYLFAIRDFIYDAEGDNLEISWTGNEDVNIEITDNTWQSVNYGTFTNLYGYINQNGESVPLEYEVGVFVGSQCRDIAVLQSYNGRSFLNTTVQGTSIEEMEIRIKDPETNEVWVCADLIPSNPGGSVGYPTFLELNCDEADLEGDLILNVTDFWIGTEEITFSVYDHENDPVQQNVIVMVLAGNHAPEIFLPDSLYAIEDESLIVDFTEYINDVDDDELTLAQLNNLVNIQVEITGFQVNITADANWYGSEELEFEVSDPGGLSSTDQMVVEFISVNDVPDLELPSELVWDEDSEYVIDLAYMISDAENDELTVIWEENEYLEIEESEINWEPVEYSQTMLIYGSVSINGEAIASDDIIAAFVGNECRGIGYRWGSSNFTTFNLFTEEPEELYFRILDVSENITYGVDLVIVTIPGGVAGYPPNFLQLAGNTVINNLSYKITPDDNWFGDTYLALTVTDSEGGAAEDNLNVTITGVNDLPLLNLPESLEIDMGDILDLDLTGYIVDIDGDSLYITAESEFLVTEINEMTLEIDCGNTVPGIYDLQINVYDGTETVSDNISVEVIDNNQIPEFELPGEISFTEDSEIVFNWQQYAIDPDGDSLVILWSGNEQIIIQQIENGDILLSAAPNWYGIEQINFQISDGFATVIDTMNIIVTAVNDAPEYIGVYNMEFDEDSVYQTGLAEFWLDIDTDELEIGGFSELLQVAIIGDTLELTPEENWNGDCQLELWADDGENTVTINVDITVNSVNDDPWLAIPEEIEINEDGNFSLDLSDYSGDVDGDQLVYSAESNIIIIEISGSEALISAPENWYGQDTVTFTVSDEITRSEVEQDINVIINPVNDPPQLDLPESITFASGSIEEIDFNLYCSDIDSPDLLIGYSGNENIIIDVDGLIVTLSAGSNWLGMEELNFWVTDGEYQADDILTVFVTETGSNFEINLPEEMSINEDESEVIDLADHLTNNLNYSIEIELSELTNISMDINDLIIEFTGTPDWSGSEDLTVTVLSSDTGETISDVISIVVEPVNDPPVINLPDEINLQEDSTIFYSFYQYCSDIDSNQLDFSLGNGSPNLNIQIQGYNTLISGVLNYFGTEVVTFNLSDGEFTISDSILIIVNPVNDPPIINLPNSFYVNEDASLTLDMSNYILEFDNDELDLTVSGNEEIDAEIEDMEITFSAAANWYGSESITIT
ncbi:MAG: tandem-95 repeat protein, partial [Candidatus Stygibacter australis]|nr:tandem-95 repeat protein [Candidatus Stygibacter australis]